jgi:hydrogenase expression/formation protein HypC
MVGAQSAGTWILNFHGVAREVLSEQTARDIDSALQALEAAMSGETDLDRFFPDLAGRTPRRPER